VSVMGAIAFFTWATWVVAELEQIYSGLFKGISPEQTWI
jgi:hypothetical protein